jgi:predicted RNA-binding Zn ribbon-like protein
MVLMTASAHVPGFRRGAGRLSLDFIRTLRLRGTADAVEELADDAALKAWVAEFGPPGAGEPGPADPASGPGPAGADQAHRLREAIYQLVTAARGPGGPGSCPATARAAINAAAALPPPAPQLDPGGRLRWLAAEPVSAMLALLARDALELAASPAIARVRECANPACHALFLDGSRPGTRRWCSMGTCGNQAKKTNLRGRRPARARPSGT